RYAPGLGARNDSVVVGLRLETVGIGVAMDGVRADRQAPVLDVGLHEVVPGEEVIRGRVGAERIGLVVVLYIHVDAQAELLDVGHAGGLAGLLSRLREDGEQDRGENCDNSNYYE